MKAFIDRNWPDIAEPLKVIGDGERNPQGTYTKFIFKVREGYDHEDELLKEYAYYWMLFFRISGDIELLKDH